MPHVHVFARDFPGYLEQLTGLPDGVTWSRGEEPPANTEVLVAGRPSADLLDGLGQLRGLVVPFAGIPERTLALMRDRPQLALYNVHHNAPLVAEYALAMVFAVAKDLARSDRALRAGDWSPRYEDDHALLLAGRHALVFGWGEIGRRVDALLRACGLQVRAVRNRRRESDPQHVVGAAEIDVELARADVVVVCAPSTDATRGLFDGERLALLPEGAIVVNVGRADLFEPRALYEALASRRLLGAAFDVWWNYPESREARSATPPADVPLHELPNMLLSPHRSGHGAVCEQLRAEAVAEVVAAILHGDAPPRVDVLAGY